MTQLRRHTIVTRMGKSIFHFLPFVLSSWVGFIPDGVALFCILVGSSLRYRHPINSGWAFTVSSIPGVWTLCFLCFRLRTNLWFSRFILNTCWYKFVLTKNHLKLTKQIPILRPPRDSRILHTPATGIEPQYSRTTRHSVVTDATDR